jgi:hypothetical protein
VPQRHPRSALLFLWRDGLGCATEETTLVKKLERRLHLDRRAGAIAKAGPRGSKLLTTQQTADWLGISPSVVTKARAYEWGIPFIELPNGSIRYDQDKVRAWLLERERATTADYDRGKTGRPRKLATAEA